MFYVIKRENTLSRQTLRGSQDFDSDCLEISTQPLEQLFSDYVNPTDNVVFNNIHTFQHSEHESLEDAREEVRKLYGEFDIDNLRGGPIAGADGGIVETYKRSKPLLTHPQDVRDEVEEFLNAGSDSEPLPGYYDAQTLNPDEVLKQAMLDISQGIEEHANFEFDREVLKSVLIKLQQEHDEEMEETN